MMIILAYLPRIDMNLLKLLHKFMHFNNKNDYFNKFMDYSVFYSCLCIVYKTNC